jgi:hypothetical protein
VIGGVDESDPKPLALTGTERRPGHPAVVRPRRVLHPGGDLDLLLLGHQLPLADASPDDALVEVTEDRLRVEAVRRVIHRADRADMGVRIHVRGMGLRRDCLGGRERPGNEREPAEKVSTRQHEV